MILGDLKTRVEQVGLAVVGAFHPDGEDGVPDGIATLILLGPNGPALWEAFAASPEFADGQANPMDRWSLRVITALVDNLAAVALFPFGGPPWQPFQKWATRGEGAVSSPVGMQATQGRGLWTSYRGALGFREQLELDEPKFTSPCADCAAPCLTACPVDAFASGTYDVPRCTAHLKTAPELPCRTGCLVRKACPYGAEMNLPKAQRRFHIDAFLRANG